MGFVIASPILFLKCSVTHWFDLLHYQLVVDTLIDEIVQTHLG